MSSTLLSSPNTPIGKCTCSVSFVWSTTEDVNIQDFFYCIGHCCMCFSFILSLWGLFLRTFVSLFLFLDVNLWQPTVHTIIWYWCSVLQVLWPECGWQAVSLTDLITSTSVKKVYHKATLCVHPDKVQQKRASLREKYIAEKVFDILKVNPYWSLNFWLFELCLHYLNKWNSKLPNHLYCFSLIICWFTHTHAASYVKKFRLLCLENILVY